MSPVRERGRGRRGFHEGRARRGAPLQILNRAGPALSLENDLGRLVQIVTDAGVELTGAEFGAFSTT
jgi:hypothetical protein